jgi:RNA polymerase sigma-70 factor (ECF subfamily)
MSSALPRPAPLPADAELPPLTSQGAAPAFAVIMRRNNRRLYRIARSILRDEVEAEEAVQETYLRAFANLHGFRGTATLSTWLARIVINEALGRLRQRRSFTGLDEIDRTAWLGQETPGALLGAFGQTSPEAAAAHRELKVLIENAVNALPASFRVVFVACAIEQISVEDVAVSLGIPKSTVRTRLYRAKRMLREALGAAFATMLDDVFPFAGSRCERIAAAVLERLGLQGPTELIEGSTGEKDS